MGRCQRICEHQLWTAGLAVVANHAIGNSGSSAVTGPNPPPNGGERGGPPLRAEPTRTVANAGKPQKPAAAPAPAPTPTKPSVTAAATLAKPAAAAVPLKAQAASPPQAAALRPAAASPPNARDRKPAVSAPQQPRPAAGEAIPRTPAPPAQPMPTGAAGASSSRNPARAAPGPAQPDPPLSERTMSGIGPATEAKAKEAKRIAPRSPRSALEPDTLDVPIRRS